MARIAECGSCGIEFYDSTEVATDCNRCNAHKAAKEAKIKRLSAKIHRWKANGAFHISFAMIDLHFRNKLSLSECAGILGITEKEAQFERDIVIENAK